MSPTRCEREGAAVESRAGAGGMPRLGFLIAVAAELAWLAALAWLATR